ncbi:hypothetical protein GF337_15425 [candidate division KSB1 bacterium]|nr:hypothetical protein [candidate division KSB1 bacterium]
MQTKQVTIYKIALIFIAFFSQAIYPQTDERIFINNIRFEQNFNIYKWRYGFRYQKQIPNRGTLTVREDFASSLLRIRQNEKKWKDDQNLTINYSQRFSPKWAGTLKSSSLLFSDKLSGITNDIKTSFGSFGIQYQPLDIVNIETILGYKFDIRYDQRDHGTMYGFNINTPFINLSEYYNKFDFSVQGDDFGSRENRDLVFRYFVNKEFYTDTADSLAITYSKKRRDNYDRWDVNNLYIESLYEDIANLYHTLSYRVSDAMKFQIKSDITSRKTRVQKLDAPEAEESRAKRDITSYNEISLRLNVGRLNESLRLSYTTQNQKNEVPDSLKNSPFSFRFSYVSPDFKSSRLSLTNSLNFSFFSRDTLFSNVSVSLFRYDTPEETNFDDRDELSVNASLSEVHYFSPILKLRLNASVNLKHLVFIYGEKSANNNWMRIFRLNPELNFRPNDRFKWYQSYEVLANYVDYDFEEQFNPIDIRSYVFRKFTMLHLINRELNRRMSININYKLELEENGKFFWDKWTEILIATRNNHYSKLYLDYELFPNATVSLGGVFYKRAEQFHITDSSTGSARASLNDYISYGPSLVVNYHPHSKLQFTFTGTRRKIDRVNQNSYYISNINVDMSWYL